MHALKGLKWGHPLDAQKALRMLCRAFRWFKACSLPFFTPTLALPHRGGGDEQVLSRREGGALELPH